MVKIKEEAEYWKYYENIKGNIASDSYPIFFYGPNTDDRVEFINKRKGFDL